MINRQSIIDTVIDNIKSGNYARAYMGETKENVPTARFALDRGVSANVTKGKGLLITIQVYEQDLQGIDFEQAAQFACDDQVRRAEMKLDAEKQKRSKFINKFHNNN